MFAAVIVTRVEAIDVTTLLTMRIAVTHRCKPRNSHPKLKKFLLSKKICVGRE